MNLLTVILISIVVVLHLYFFVLEMFLWTKPIGRKVFRMSEVKAKETAVLAANQGLYNGFLAAGLVWSVINPNVTVGFQTSVFFLICVILAGLYGGFSVNRRIFIIQSGPAILALASLIMNMYG